MSSFRSWITDTLRRVCARPSLLPLTALLLRARAVRPAGGFVVRELLGRKQVRTYRLAESGLRVVIRHGTGDVVTLGEVFHDWDYLPAPEVERVLNGVRAIVDLGANIGLFGLFAAQRWPEAHITAFEADPANVAIHRRAVAANELEDRWTLVAAAAGARDGRVPFRAGQAALSRIADSAEPDAIDVPMRDVLPILQGADLLKMDIEGGEWAILDDPRFRASPPRVAVFEYHPYRCPAGDPHTMAERAVRAAGMQVRSVRRGPDGHGMLWAWRSDC